MPYQSLEDFIDAADAAGEVPMSPPSKTVAVCGHCCVWRLQACYVRPVTYDPRREQCAMPITAELIAGLAWIPVEEKSETIEPAGV